jgi:hypothetical protein
MTLSQKKPITKQKEDWWSGPEFKLQYHNNNKKMADGAGDMAQVPECLHRMFEDLSLIPRTTHTNNCIRRG